MAESEHGVVAAGHPLTAEAGARVLREGGNAVDAALARDAHVVRRRAAADGAGRGRVHARRRRRRRSRRCSTSSCRRRAIRVARTGSGRSPSSMPIDVSFGDAAQVFHIGPASCGVYGAPAGVCEAARRWGTIPLAELAAPAARLARDGVALNHGQAYVAEILADLLDLDARVRRAVGAATGAILREGEVLRNPELGDALMRLGERGRGAVLPRRRRRGRVATGCARAAAGSSPRTSPATAAIEREPVRDRTTATARCSRTRRPRPAARCSPTRSRCSTANPRRRSLRGVVDAMARRAGGAHAASSSTGSARTGFLERFLAQSPGRDDAHLGARRARSRMQRDLHQRRGLGRRRARHRAST